MIRALVFTLLFANPAASATLRPFTTLTTPVVNLSDLFDGVIADRPVGPGPAPGGRIIVESGQLAAIAKQFGVEWRATSSADRAILDRPGRALTKDDFVDGLKHALATAGAPADVDIDLAPIPAPLIPDHGPVATEISSLDYDTGTGRFTTMSTVTVAGMPPLSIRLAGRIAEMVDIPVLRRRLMAGDLIHASDFSWARVQAHLARGDLVHDPAQGAGQEAHRTLQAGQPVLLADIGRPTLITKGGQVSMSFDSPGIQLSAQGIAVESAGLDEIVPILNPLSHIIVHGRVTGPGRARVVPEPALQTPAVRQVAVR